MILPGKKIADFILDQARREIDSLSKRGKLKLVTILVGNARNQLSFVHIKERTAKKLGVKFEFIHIKRTPLFEKFVRIVKEKANSPETTGLIIQQPLPDRLQTLTLYKFIPKEKEIEGFNVKRPLFKPPIGLTISTILKYIFKTNYKINKELLPNFKQDRIIAKTYLRNKKIILIGRGMTGGRPIGHTLTELRINYLGVNSKTYKKERYYKEADIIISAVGKKIISRDVIKKGVILINAGLHEEEGRLRGDYDEKEIKDLADFYTTTPGGIGPIDIAYLFYNLKEAAKIQRSNQ